MTDLERWCRGREGRYRAIAKAMRASREEWRVIWAASPLRDCPACGERHR